MAEPVKRICIISRAQIRYEGDFVSVEYHETCGRTITLANVRSFGTENRPAEKKAPPKDVIYEKIMFTENDLVSITFVEEADIIDDPSIVIVEPPYSSNIAPIGTKPVNNQASMSHRHDSDSWNDQKQDGLKFEEKKPARPNAWGQPTRTNSDQNQSNWNSGNSQQSNKPYHNNPMNHPNSSSHHQQSQNQYQSRNTQQVKSPRQNGPNRYNNNNSGQNNRGNYSGGNMRGYGNNNRGNYRNHYNNNRRNNASNNNTKENDIPITGEYDIESANKELAAELEKLEIGAGDRGESTNAGESGRDSQDEKEEEDKVVYDSTKSIFDQLSSQMLDKAMGKKTITQSFRDERKLNSTTFGSLGGSYNDHHHRRNYNRNYGNQQNYRRGGGGNYRRGGYRNNNNYNSNNTNSNLVEADK